MFADPCYKLWLPVDNLRVRPTETVVTLAGTVNRDQIVRYCIQHQNSPVLCDQFLYEDVGRLRNPASPPAQNTINPELDASVKITSCTLCSTPEISVVQLVRSHEFPITAKHPIRFLLDKKYRS